MGDVVTHVAVALAIFTVGGGIATACLAIPIVLGDWLAMLVLGLSWVAVAAYLVTWLV